MGVPYSQEVKTAVDLAADLKFAVTCFIIILTIFLSFIVVAVIALLITVNQDLVEERKALVTPVLKLGLWGLTPIILGRRTFVGTTEEPREERRRDEGRGENENQSVHDSGRVQRRRRASPM
jgi:cadmium resistance protein CadD (predicted permease)